MKRLFLIFLISACAAITATAASVNIAGTATGVFSDNTRDVSFTPNAGFNVTTAANGSYDDAQFGTFSISSCGFNGPNCSDSGTFTLSLNFTVPAGIGNPITATADVTGSFNFFNDTASISFDNQADQTIHYTNSSGSGSFVLTFDSDDDISLCTGSFCSGTPSSQLGTFDIASATFTANSSTPEPEVTVLFITMLCLVGLVTRKKFSRKLS